MLAHGRTHALCLFLREDWKTILLPSQWTRPRGGLSSEQPVEVFPPQGVGPGLWEQASPSLCLVWLGLIWVWLGQPSLTMGAPAPSVSAKAAALGRLVRQVWGRGH